MAGAGYKLFNTGDVLTAAQVNTYLQEQVVMRFATTSARTTALSGVLAEGMVSYIDATDTLEVYNGSAWVSATGDITEIQAGTGITVTNGAGPIATVALTTPVSAANGGTGLSSLGTGVATFLGTPSSANLAAALTDETGTGSNVFATNPVLVTPNLGTPSAGTLTNCTGLPISGLVASTSLALGVGSIELGNASDTTLARVSAGVVSVEGVNVVTTSSTDTLTNKTLTAPIINLALNAQTGTTYTFVLADNGKLVTASNASAQTYTIPTNATAAFATGAQINLIAIGAGQVTVQGAGGVTVASTGATSTAPKLRAQYSSATCIKVATDTWYVVGDIS